VEKIKVKQKKACNPEVLKRVFEIEQLIAQCWSYSQIVRYSAEKWGIAERQTTEYIQRVYAHFKQDFEKNHDKYKEILVNNYLEIARKAYTNNNFSASVQALNGLSKILGLSIDKVDATFRQTYSDWIEGQKKEK